MFSTQSQHVLYVSSVSSKERLFCSASFNSSIHNCTDNKNKTPIARPLFHHIQKWHCFHTKPKSECQSPSFTQVMITPLSRFYYQVTVTIMTLVQSVRACVQSRAHASAAQVNGSLVHCQNVQPETYASTAVNAGQAAVIPQVLPALHRAHICWFSLSQKLDHAGARQLVTWYRAE